MFHRIIYAISQDTVPAGLTISAFKFIILAKLSGKRMLRVVEKSGYKNSIGWNAVQGKGDSLLVIF